MEISANWEVLWNGSVSEGNGIYFDRKTYRIFAIEVMGTTIIFINTGIEERESIVGGSPVLLNDGSKWVLYNRCIYLDNYADHFYFKSVADYSTSTSNIYNDGRTITAIYGVK